MTVASAMLGTESLRLPSMEGFRGQTSALRAICNGALASSDVTVVRRPEKKTLASISNRVDWIGQTRISNSVGGLMACNGLALLVLRQGHSISGTRTEGQMGKMFRSRIPIPT
eukprot:COSAG02_NODE_4033_length_5881_cov_4.410412_1_plen_113_part_00